MNLVQCCHIVMLPGNCCVTSIVIIIMLKAFDTELLILLNVCVFLVVKYFW